MDSATIELVWGYSNADAMRMRIRIRMRIRYGLLSCFRSGCSTRVFAKRVKLKIRKSNATSGRLRQRQRGRELRVAGRQGLSGIQKQNCKVIGNENSFRVRIGMNECVGKGFWG